MRNGLVDYGRLIAALGIVWFHTKAPGYPLAYAGLPYFLTLLFLAPPRWSRPWLANRAWRLLWPFALWSAIYGLQRVSDAWQAGEPLFGWAKPEMLAMGTADHLWFLPYAFVALAVAPLIRATRAELAWPLVAAGLLVLAGPITAFPWYQWSFGLIPILVGLAHLRFGPWAALALAASCGVLWVGRPHPDVLTILIGSGLAILAMQVRTRATPMSDLCARLAVWVYLGHMLVVVQLKGTGWTGMPLALAAMAGSLVLAWSIDVLIRRLWPGRAAATDPRPPGRPAPP
jgi:hypothetical protein